MFQETEAVATIDFAAIFNNLPGMYLLLSPELKVLAATDAYLAAIGHERTLAIGMPVMELYRASAATNTDFIQSLTESLSRIQSDLKPHTTKDLPFHQSGQGQVPLSERYWRITNIPVLNGQQVLTCILHRASDVTIQYQALQEGKNYRKSFQLLTKTTSEAVWEWDFTTNRISLNEGFLSLLDSDSEDVISADHFWSELIHPDDRSYLESSLDKTIRKGRKLFTATFRLAKSDGSFSHVQNKAFILYNDQKQAARMVGTVTDLDKQEQAERELSEAHQRMYLLLESIPQLAWTADPDAKINFLNSRWEQYTGATRQQLIGQEKLLDFMHPDDREIMWPLWQSAQKTGTSFELEYRWLRHSDQTYRWHLARVLPVRNEEGEVVQWVGTATDIEDQKKVQQELEKSSQQFRFLADTMPQLVWTTDPNGSHDYFNQRWVEYTGYDVETSKGMDMWNDLLHPDDRARARERWNHSLKTGEPYEIEYRFLNSRAGTYRWFLGRALPMRDENGQIVRWFGTSTDIEEQKAAEETLTAKNKELEQINDDLDSFVYTASHDLKLPIININALFEELLQTVEFRDKEGENMVSLIRKSLAQVRDTIDDLGEIVKVQKNINAQLEEVDLRQLIEEVKLSIKDQITSAKAVIETDFSRAPKIRFSRVNLKSILYNLISNAVKFRAPDRDPVVQVKTWVEGDYMILQVSDNGIGLDLQKYGEKMFQMFRRFHNHVPGSGLGLYILNRIVQKSGGHCHVSSEVNKGSTFTLYFTTQEHK